MVQRPLVWQNREMVRLRRLRYLPLLCVLALILVSALRQRQRDWNPGEFPADLPRDRPAEVLEGHVDYVFDGDTVELRTGDRRWRIRLEGIDAPEQHQPFGAAARDFLVQLCDQQPVRVVVVGRDRYHRILGDVYRDDTWINAQIVLAGYAWERSRSSRAAELAELQRQAQHAGRGLWVDPAPVPPWEFRRAHCGRRRARRVDDCWAGVPTKPRPDGWRADSGACQTLWLQGNARPANSQSLWRLGKLRHKQQSRYNQPTQPASRVTCEPAQSKRSEYFRYSRGLA